MSAIIINDREMIEQKSMQGLFDEFYDFITNLVFL